MAQSPEANNLAINRIQSWVNAQGIPNGRAYSPEDYGHQLVLLELVVGLLDSFDRLQAKTGKKETFVRQPNGGIRIVLVDDTAVSTGVGTECVDSVQRVECESIGV